MSQTPPGPTSDENPDNLATVTAALLQRWPENQIQPDLLRVQQLLDIMGSPQLTVPGIHIAGTNGKTSTTRFVDGLVRAHALRGGMYLSPHLHSITERICLHGEPISDEYFVAHYREIAPYAELVDAQTGRLTMFELLTALAFVVFADAPVDVMTIETGMGGRWDATNVMRPEVCVITPIGLDHQDYLGDSVAEIAAEKAGIITAPVPVVVGKQPVSALAVIRQQAEQLQAPLLVIDEDFAVLGRELHAGGQVFDVRTPYGEYRDVKLAAHGPHQVENAATAIVAMEAFFGGRRLAAELVAEALGEVSSPGRLEVLGTSPLILADAAHNAHGVAALVGALHETVRADQFIAVLAVMADKDLDEMLNTLADVVDRIILTENSSPRCLSAAAAAEIAGQYWDDDRIEVQPFLNDAIDIAVAEADNLSASGIEAAVLITGSVVTVADASSLLGGG